MNMLLINALLQKINFALSNYDDYEIKNIYHDCITNSLFVVVFYEQEIEEEHDSYVDVGYFVYSYIKDETNTHRLKIDNSFENCDSVADYIAQEFSQEKYVEVIIKSENV